MSSPSAAPTFLAGRPALRWLAIIAAIVLVEAVALYNALPGLNDEVWQDEAFTLLVYAGHDFWFPFTNYFTPNNHVLFSALLAVWKDIVPDPFDQHTLRLLPLSCFLIAVAATFAAGYRLKGFLCGLVAALLFASGTVTVNHATQLRGYAAAWPAFALMFLCALNINGPRAMAWRIGYIVFTVMAVATLPSNFVLALILAGAVVLYHLAGGMARTRGNLQGLGLLLAGPVIGLSAYAMIWQNLMTLAGMDWSGWSRPLLFGQWLIATLGEFGIVALAAFLGFAIALWGTLKSTDDNRRRAMLATVLFAVSIPAGIVAMIYVLPNPPFPRTFVPILPVWYCLIALLVAVFADALAKRWRYAAVAMGLVSCLSVWHGLQTQPCGGLSVKSGEAEQWDLCRQFFRQDYHPSRTLAALIALQAKEPRLIVADFEGKWPLVRLAQGRFKVMHYRMDYLPIRKALGDPLPPADYPILVVDGEAQLRRLTTFLSLDINRYRLVDDSGHFKVYTVAP